MSRFPNLPETFILREMVEMQSLGWEISIYPLIVQNQAVVHPQARALFPQIHRTALLSCSLIQANLSMLFQHPRLYISTAARVIAENISSPKFLLRALIVFPKSVEMACRMRAEGVAHIHAHFATHPALAAWIIHQFTGISYSVTVHAHDIFVERPMLATKLKSAEFIDAISDFNCRYLAEVLGDWIRPKIRVIHCGVFPEVYTSLVPRQEIDTLKIVSIGSLQPYKGQKYLIEACAELKRKGIPIRCQIIGGGELRDVLSRQIESLGLQDVVELTGPKTQEEVATLLSQADCYIQPSIITAKGKMEGIPVSIMEAMLCGVPVIATSISGVPEIVHDHKTGLLVAPADVPALVEAIEVLYQDRECARQMAQNGKQLVLEQFNLHTNVRQLSELIEKTIEARPV